MARAPQKAPQRTQETENTPTLPHPRAQIRPLGHDRVIAGFERALGSGLLPHAWLLTGCEGIGKATVAYYLTRKLFVASATGFFAPTDDEMAQRIAKGSHPDLLVLETTEDKTTIPVDDVRDIMHLMHHTPYESYRRIVIIDPIEALNSNAANALLKVLEEPPAHAIFFLISHHPAKLLPTIRSRCFMVHMHAPPLTETLTISRNLQPAMPAHEATAYLQFANQAPGFAIQLADAHALRIYQDALNYIHELKQPTLAWDRPLLKHIDTGCFAYVLDMAFNRIIKYASAVPIAETWVENEADLLNNIARLYSIKDLLNLRESLLEQLNQADRVHLDKVSILRSMPAFV